MNTELLIQLVEQKQQALRAERSGVKPPRKRQTTWMLRIQNWLNQARTQPPTATVN